MIKRRSKLLAVSLTAPLALGLIVAAGSGAGSAGPSGATAQAAVAPVSVPALTKKERKKLEAKKARAKRERLDRVHRKCRRHGDFNERRIGYSRNAIKAGRCIASKFGRVKLISSYQGHHPSAARAIDVMVNLRGSCSAGRKTGNRIANYLMRNKKELNIYYVGWRNRYWNARSPQMKIKKWRYLGDTRNCTHMHFDHLHVAFN